LSGNVTDEVWKACIEDQKPEMLDDNFNGVQRQSALRGFHPAFSR
jgi:hypothetical protein